MMLHIGVDGFDTDQAHMGKAHPWENPTSASQALITPFMNGLKFNRGQLLFNVDEIATV